MFTLGRVEFRAGRLIRAVDLAARDADRRYRLHLHQALQHGAGIVRGLRLKIVGTRVRVTPGLAIDAHGRQLWLSKSATIELRPAEIIGIWLTLVETAALPNRRGRIETCADRLGRIRETAMVVTRPGGSSAGAVAVECDVSGDVLAPLAEPDIPADVYLGSVLRDNVSVRRVHAHGGARAEAIAAGSGDVSALLGYGPAAVAPRFAVSLDDAAPRLEVDPERKTAIRGSVAARNVKAPRILFGRAGAPAERARPWSLARVAVPQPNRPPRDVLRFEIEDPDGKGNPAERRFEVGSTRSTPLVVMGNGNVSMSGLGVFKDDARQVAGELVRAPIPADPSDPRFAAAAGDALIGGMGVATERSFVQGEVVNKAGQPVSHAVVELFGLGLKQPVDKLGRFVFPRVGWPGQVVFALASAAGSEPRVVAGLVGSTLRIMLIEVAP